MFSFIMMMKLYYHPVFYKNNIKTATDNELNRKDSCIFTIVSRYYMMYQCHFIQKLMCKSGKNDVTIQIIST